MFESVSYLTLHNWLADSFVTQENDTNEKSKILPNIKLFTLPKTRYYLVIDSVFF